MKNFMKQNKIGQIFVRMILLVSIVVVAGCAARYVKGRNADEMLSQKEEEQQPKIKVVKKNVKRLQFDKNGLVKKDQENLAAEQTKSEFTILKRKNKFGLSNDDFWSYAILENQVRLQIFLYGSKHSKKEALQAVNVFIEFLKDVRDAEQFEDPDLSVRIDEQIYNERDLKAHIRKNDGLIPDKEYTAGMKELRKYFRDCRKAGQDFQSAVGNCKPTLTGEMEPELG